jgi:hypothetical protein
VARFRSAVLRGRFGALALGKRPIVAGPWLGEVGFELLYWIPFLRWFAGEFRIDPARIIAVSRGGTASWYQPFAGAYHDVFGYVSEQEVRRYHHERLRARGQQKQIESSPFERELQRTVAANAGVGDAAVLHPSTMFELFNPYWWQHLDETWVHRHARYVRMQVPDLPAMAPLPERYAAVKFYFNDSFRDTECTRALVHGIVRRLSERMPVVSLATGLNVDDHGACAVDGHAVVVPPLGVDARSNLHVQSAILARASSFAGTYGGFSYLAPFYGVPTVAYYDDPARFSSRHLAMARSAFASLGIGGLFEVRGVNGEYGGNGVTRRNGVTEGERRGFTDDGAG